MRTSPEAMLATVSCCFGLCMIGAPVPRVAAQESWDPFKQRWEQAQPRRPGPTADAAPTAAFGARSGSTGERAAPPPVIAPDASGLPPDLWRGLDIKTVEQQLARLDLPPRSPAVQQLWRRMLLSSAMPPSGSPTPEHFLALRLEGLYRSGLLGDMEKVLHGASEPGPIVQAIKARRDIGLGRREAGCRTIAALATPSSGLPGRLKGETQLLAGYCAAVTGDVKAAGLAAELAREEGLDAELPLAILAGLATATKPQLALPARVLLLDYRFLELMGVVDVAQVFDRAEPALLAVLAGDTKLDAKLQVAAAEAALRVNALSTEAVAAVYRRQSFSARDAGDSSAQHDDPLLRRALFFRAVEAARSPSERARMARAMLQDARRSGLYVQAAHMLAPLLADLRPTREVAWFAETCVEVQLAAGRLEDARRWAHAAGLAQWLTLIDIADPEQRRGSLQSLLPIEELAVRGRLADDTLHRLATALDALDLEVPMPLWEAASRTPQPSTGYLPETGVLADLAQSVERGVAGRAILLAMRALGPAGPQGANLLALRDVVRALRHIGLESDARRIALEALMPGWPRQASN